MKLITRLLSLAAVTIFLGACAHGPQHGPGPGGPCCPKKQDCPPCPNCPRAGAAAVPAQQSPAAIYWCACGPECKCNGAAKQPGKCGCGKELAGGHVVWTEGSAVLACTCGPDCTCALDPNDRSKCGCGRPVKRIDLKGTGLYYCSCGGACGCNSVSDKPGSCAACGMQLHQ